MAKRLVTQAEWARERGVSKPYASKLVKSGKIKLVDGKIDPEDADKRLNAVQDVVKHAQRKVVHHHSVPFETAPVKRKKAERDEPSDFADDEIPASQLADELLRARIKTQREDGRLKELARIEREGKLIDAAEVTTQQLRRATQEREALLNWPSRIAAAMAADLGVQDKDILQVLRKYVRQHLMERSTQPISE